MSKFDELRNEVKKYDLKRRHARSEAMRLATEQVSLQKSRLQEKLYEIHNSGIGLSKLAEEAGLSRSTVYNWIKEFEKKVGGAEEAAISLWSNTRKNGASGEVLSDDSNGDTWVFSSDGVEYFAWNRTQNSAEFGEDNWPVGSGFILDMLKQDQ